MLLPVTTPFDPVTGEVAPVSFRDNLRRWLAASVDGVVLFGSTGEGVLLDEEEKLSLMEFSRDVVPAPTFLVAGAGAESTRATARLARELGRRGADAVLVHPPSYFGTTLRSGDLLRHYRTVADASPVPVLVYHIPKFTHVKLDPGLVGRLAEHPNIAGMKDSSGDLKRFGAYTQAVPSEFRLLIGSGALLYTALELGAAGGIVAVGLLAAVECAGIVREFRAGNTREAGRLQTRIAPVHRQVVGRFGARGVKAALDLLEYVGGPPRPPLSPLPEKDTRRVRQILEDAELGKSDGLSD